MKLEPNAADREMAERLAQGSGIYGDVDAQVGLVLAGLLRERERAARITKAASPWVGDEWADILTEEIERGPQP